MQTIQTLEQWPLLGMIPEIEWKHGDDLCDCTFQRIGMWKNPYLAETLEVRMCCIWAELYKQFPQFVRTIPGYFDDNAGEWITEPMEWNGETEMPRALHFRQVSRKLGVSLDEAREHFPTPPAGKPRKDPVTLYVNSPFGWVPLVLD